MMLRALLVASAAVAVVARGVEALAQPGPGSQRSKGTAPAEPTIAADERALTPEMVRKYSALNRVVLADPKAVVKARYRPHGMSTRASARHAQNLAARELRTLRAAIESTPTRRPAEWAAINRLARLAVLEGASAEVRTEGLKTLFASNAEGVRTGLALLTDRMRFVSARGRSGIGRDDYAAHSPELVRVGRQSIRPRHRPILLEEIRRLRRAGERDRASRDLLDQYSLLLDAAR